MDKKKFKFTFLIAGSVSIILALLIFLADTGSFMSSMAYGGDAYTGIQNAAATTANNVIDVACIVSSGFAAVLLVIGILLIGIGISIKKENLDDDNNVKDTLDEKKFTFNKSNTKECKEESSNEKPNGVDVTNI